MSGLTLFSVGALVVSVSLSLLGEVAAHENERDALHTLERLREAWIEAEPLPEPTLGGLGATAPEWFGRLRDHRWVAADPLLRHGYLFRAEVRNGTGPRLVAWPARFGRSGSSAYAVDVASGAAWTHLGRAEWSGINASPVLPAVGTDSREPGGWREVTR